MNLKHNLRILMLDGRSDCKVSKEREAADRVNLHFRVKWIFVSIQI